MNRAGAVSGPWPPVAIWLVPCLAVLLLLVFSDTGVNRHLFLAVNGWAPTLPPVFWADVTVLGDTLVAFCLTLPFLRRRPDIVLALLLATLPALLLSHGLKALFAVPRPVLALGDIVYIIGDDIRNRTSFPSGHTTTVFVLAGVLAAGLRQQGLAWLAVLLASMVAFSRIAVGAHWPADVAGGALCGWFSGLFGHYLAGRLAWAGRPRLLAVIRLALVAAAVHLLFTYDSDVEIARPFERTLALAILLLHLLPGWRMAGGPGGRAAHP